MTRRDPHLSGPKTSVGSLKSTLRQGFSTDLEPARVYCEEKIRTFAPTDFIVHMEEHRKDVAVMLERHWRDYIVSEAGARASLWEIMAFRKDLWHIYGFIMVNAGGWLL